MVRLYGEYFSQRAVEKYSHDEAVVTAKRDAPDGEWSIEMF